MDPLCHIMSCTKSMVCKKRSITDKLAPLKNADKLADSQ